MPAAVHVEWYALTDESVFQVCFHVGLTVYMWLSFSAVQFMWDCLFESLERSKKPEKSAGCILAHCMGLGKTLSVSYTFAMYFSETCDGLID